jgi:hypothetical protein
MSQTKVWSADLGNTCRKRRTTGATAGSGNNQRMYVGYFVGYDYTSYLRFGLDWTGVGRIVSAVLSLYTDDGLGDLDLNSSGSPYVVVRRLTTAFSEGVGPGSTMAANDYTTATGTTSDQKIVNANRAAMGLTSVDITDMVEDWAPSTVKRRDGSPGGRAANYGIALVGSSLANRWWAGWSEDYTDSTYRPIVTLTFEYGTTTPHVPQSLTPSGSVSAFTDFQGSFSDDRATDELRYSEVEAYSDNSAFTVATNDYLTSAAHGLLNGAIVYLTTLTGGAGLATFTKYYVVGRTADTFKVSTTLNGTAVNVTTTGSGTWAKQLYSQKRASSRTEIDAARFSHVPDSMTVVAGVTYQWRARTYDQEGQVSAWTALTSFSTTNTVPNPPTLTPSSASSFASLDGVLFRGLFSDPDEGDTLLAYQVQMSAYASGDSHWSDDQFILWNTGKVYVATGSTSFSTPYGGNSLDAGTYYWRARAWDNKQGYSDWAYATIVVTDAFVPDPADSPTSIQLRIRAPWRIVIKDMLQSDGVTKTVGRGPGRTVAVLEDAKNVGASILYNSPGELHFTLGKSHPQLSVIEVKQTHYSVQFRSGDGWREVFAGLMWDFDATDTDIVFYGIDYLALLDYTLDERYDQSNPDKPSESGGSKYVSTGKNSISYIVNDQLTRAKNLPNSPVGFISVGSIASMTETLTVFSTYSPTLSFVTGLLDSHRAGTGKKTRISVRPKTGGGYEFVVQDDPGQVRDNLRLRYGELVQGYRVIPFGTAWASRISAIGRAKDGVQVLYKTASAPGIDEATWGRFAQVRLIDGVSDENDLMRRTKQAAVHAGKLGTSVSLGIRTGVLQPRDGYDVCDLFPVDIEDGSVSTSAFGSGYWSAVGVTWQAESNSGKQTTFLTLSPKEDAVAPSSDLLSLRPISPQAEWQVGWTAPNPLLATAKYWLNQSTGAVSLRTTGIIVVDGTLTGTA